MTASRSVLIQIIQQGYCYQPPLPSPHGAAAGAAARPGQPTSTIVSSAWQAWPGG